MARLNAEQLGSNLKRGLAPVYLVTGDEPLISLECCDAIRQHAREQGFLERDLYHTDAGFSWDELYNANSAMSLFADKKVIEIRIHNGKPGDAGSKAIVEFCENTNEDTLLLLVSPKIDNRSQSSKWFKAIERVGSVVTVWPIGPAQMHRWLDTRLKKAGLSADNDAIDILATKTEGNLLAAVQEIEKLKLQTDNALIDAQLMTSAVSDSARYSLFEMVDKAIFGDSAGAAHSLQGLRAEGSEALQVLWALSRDIRSLTAIKEAMESGESFELAARNAGVWEKRKPVFKKALHRLQLQHLHMLLRKSALADRLGKGMASGDIWNLLLDITLGLAGVNVLSAKTARLEMR